MNGEMITVEYAGPADRQVGPLPCYEVRAWWVVRDDGSIGRVKLAAGRELKKHVQADHVEFVCMDMSTYNTPHLNAMITFRVRTHAQHLERERMRALRVPACGKCFDPHPINYLQLADGERMGVCYTCLRALSEAGEIARNLASVGRGGKLNV